MQQLIKLSEIEVINYPSGFERRFLFPDIKRNMDICVEVDHYPSFLLEMLALLSTHIDRTRTNDFKSKLVIPYMPYGREDKTYGNIKSPLWFVRDMLLGYQRIYTADPHSGKVLNVFKGIKDLRLFEIDIFEKQKSAIEIANPKYLVAPDKGSEEKISWLADKLNLGFIKCKKTRDAQTGKLSGFQVLRSIEPNSPCLIVDDICDGGGTFLGLADKLKEAGAGNLSLLVTHGIFSKGKELSLIHI